MDVLLPPRYFPGMNSGLLEEATQTVMLSDIELETYAEWVCHSETQPGT